MKNILNFSGFMAGFKDAFILTSLWNTLKLPQNQSWSTLEYNILFHIRMLQWHI